MSSSSVNHRKSSVVTSSEKNKSTTGKLDAHEHLDTVKRSSITIPLNIHRKSDADKTLSATDVHLKVSEEPRVYESKEFAGVTIIFRSSLNSKSTGNLDIQGKTNTQTIRRKSDLPQTQFNVQDR